MTTHHLWPVPINPSPTYGDGEVKEPEPIKIGGWTAERGDVIQQNYATGFSRNLGPHWTITAPNGNEIVEINDIRDWSDLEDFALFILAAQEQARKIEGEE